MPAPLRHRRACDDGFAMYSDWSATATSSSFVAPSSGWHATPTEIETRGPVRSAMSRTASPDALGDLVRLDPVRSRQDHGELVAAIAVRASPSRIAASQRRGDAGEERVAGGMAAGVVEGLERVEIQHQQRERRPPRRRSSRANSRWNWPWLRSPVSASCSARTLIAPWASAFSRAIDAWPANSFVSSNSFWLKWASGSAHPPDVQRPDHLGADPERHDDHRLRLERRARDLDRRAGRGGRRW